MDDCPDSFAYLVMASTTSHLYIPPRQLIYIPVSGFFSIFFVTCITNGVSFLLIVLLTSQHLVQCLFTVFATPTRITTYFVIIVHVYQLPPDFRLFFQGNIFIVLFSVFEKTWASECWSILGGETLGRHLYSACQIWKSAWQSTSRSLFRVGVVAADVFVSTH